MNFTLDSGRLGSNIKITPSQNLPGCREISFLISDGVFSKRPRISPAEARNNHDNVHRWLEIQSESSDKKKWLKSLGQGIASYFSLSRRRDKYILSDFPSGYQIFDHVKNSRHTPFLFGYPAKSKLILRFRTANEFLPHLIWLASLSEKNVCTCKCCKSSSLSVEGPEISIQSLVPVPDSSLFKTNIKKESKQEAHQAVNTGQANLHQREGTSGFRLGELVWCELDPQDVKIRLDSKYWPGICQETRVTLKACEVTEISAHLLDPIIQPRAQNCREMVPETLKSKKEVKKKRVWQIQLLGVSDSVIRTEFQILPWLYRPLEEAAWSVVSTGKLPLPAYVLDPRNPLPNFASLSNPVLARLSFQLAVQIGGEIEESWAPAEHSAFFHKPHLDQKLPGDSSSHKIIMQAKSIWLGAEKILAADLVRLKLLATELNATNGTSRHINNQVLFLHISFFWKLPDSNSAVVAGQIFELVRSSQLSPQFSVPIGMKELQPGHGWLKQCADQVPSSLDADSSDQLPPPPNGFAFLKITPAHKIHHLDLRCIAGRYYSPQDYHGGLGFLRNHLSINQDCNPALKLESSKRKELKRLLGMTPGQENFMRFKKIKSSREEILREAHKNSQELMSSHFRVKSPDGKP